MKRIKYSFNEQDAFPTLKNNAQFKNIDETIYSLIISGSEDYD
jgi:hypothetical protein